MKRRATVMRDGADGGYEERVKVESVVFSELVNSRREASVGGERRAALDGFFELVDETEGVGPGELGAEEFAIGLGEQLAELRDEFVGVLKDVFECD